MVFSSKYNRMVAGGIIVSDGMNSFAFAEDPYSEYCLSRSRFIRISSMGILWIILVSNENKDCSKPRRMDTERVTTISLNAFSLYAWERRGRY